MLQCNLWRDVLHFCGFLQRRMSGCCLQKLRQRVSTHGCALIMAAIAALASMPLSLPHFPRTLRHTRSIDVQAFAREDGLMDLDAHICDIRWRDTPLEFGTRIAGAPLHDLYLRISIDRDLNIIEAEAVSDAVPYPGFCDTIGPAYKALVGLNLRKNFRLGLKQRLAGVAGCTHLTELAQVLPTAAIQAFAGDAPRTEPGDKIPFQLDKCHALRIDGPVVAAYYPRWSIPSIPK